MRRNTAGVDSAYLHVQLCNGPECVDMLNDQDADGIAHTRGGGGGQCTIDQLAHFGDYGLVIINTPSSTALNNSLAYDVPFMTGQITAMSCRCVKD